MTADAGAGTRCTRCTLASVGRWLPCPKAQYPRHATTKHRGVLKTSNARRHRSEVANTTPSFWTRRTTTDYARECDRSEIWVVLQNEAVHREVRFTLKNSTVGKGKCMASDIPELGSREGDRLEPPATRMDTAQCDDQSAFPPSSFCSGERRCSRLYTDDIRS